MPFSNMNDFHTSVPKQAWKQQGTIPRAIVLETWWRLERELLPQIIVTVKLRAAKYSVDQE